MWPFERRIRLVSIRGLYRVGRSAALLAMLPISAVVAQSGRDSAIETTEKENRTDDLRKLSFLGVYSVRLSSDRPDPETIHSFGEFTLEGPGVESLRPMLTKDASVVGTQDGELFFYGPYRAGRIDPRTGSRSRFDEESIGRQPHGGNTTAMAFDKRRNRLLLSHDTYLYAYDPAAKRWLWRKDIQTALLGLAYDPDRDLFYGVLGESLNPRELFLRERMLRHPEAGGGKVVLNAPLKIRHFTPEGESHVEVTVHKPLPPKPIPYNFQTTFSQGLLVLFTDHSLFAINPATGEVVHRGETTLVRDGQPWKSTRRLSLSLEERQEKLRQRIAALRDRLSPKQAAELNARLDYLSSCTTGDFSKNVGSQRAEVHTVGMSNVGRSDTNTPAICSVTVSHAAAPLILILSAYESTTWQLNIGPNVQVNQIILAGYNNHRVEGAPGGTPILERNQLTEPQHYLYVTTGSIGANAREGFSGLTHSMLGAEPMTFQYEYNKSAFEIGPGDEKWRASYLDALTRDLERELLLTENEDLEFVAILRQGGPDELQAGLTTFSWRGPKQPSKMVLNKRGYLATTATENGDRFFTDATNELFVIRRGEVAPLVSPEKDQPGRTTATVYDAPRDRLLAWHSRENRDKNSVSHLGRVLIVYDLRKHAWEQIGSLGASIAGTAHDEKRDVFYGLVLPHFSNAVRDLVVMNHRGAVLESVPLSQPFYWDLEAGPPQAVFARNHLIVVNSPQSVLLPDGKERLVSQVIAIDPATGQTYFTGRYFCD